ncbi:MAG: Rid family detoxifying hydrolase [bacterium]
MKKWLCISILFLFFIGCTEETINREIITAPDAPAAIGPYSQAVRVGNRLYLSGQLGMDPETGRFVKGGFRGQVRQALNNQKAVLLQAGFSLRDVVQCQVFLTDLNNYSDFNAIYTEFFKDSFPARAVLEVSRIPADGLVEIMMVAEKTNP